MLSREKILTKALLKASDSFGIARNELAIILGISEPTLSRIYNQERFIDTTSKEGELAILILRMYQNLTSLFGGNLTLCREWLRNNNSHLNGAPIELAKQIRD